MDRLESKIMEDELLPELEMSIIPRKRGKVRVELMNVSQEFKDFLSKKKTIDSRDIYWDIRDVAEADLGKMCAALRERYREILVVTKEANVYVSLC